MERTSSLKKGTPKDSQGFGPYQKKPFHGPHHNKKEAPTGNAPMGAIPHKAVTNRFPQVGGNRTSEASGVVFDPTQGDEGMETPPPNDSFQASRSSPVGGRLRSFRRDWLTNKCSDNVLNIITNGYFFPFISKQNLLRGPLIQSGYKPPTSAKGLWSDREIKATHKCSRAEGGFSGPSQVQGPVSKRNSVSCHRQLNSGSLHKQTR